MRQIALAFIFCLAASSAFAQRTSSTAVSTDAKTINGQSPAASATVDATNLANDSGALSPASQNEPITQSTATTVTSTQFSCGQGLKLTATSNITATLPAIAGSQPLAAGCWFDIFYPVTSATTLTVNACTSGCGGDTTDAINASAAGTPQTVTIYPTWYGIRFVAYPDGAGSGTFHTIGLPPGYLGTVTGYLGTTPADLTSTHTIGSADCGQTLNFNSGSGANWTLPHTISQTCEVTVCQKGAGQATFVNDGTSTGPLNKNGYTKTAGQHACVVIMNVEGANAWTLGGEGA